MQHKYAYVRPLYARGRIVATPVGGVRSPSSSTPVVLAGDNQYGDRSYKIRGKGFCSIALGRPYASTLFRRPTQALPSSTCSTTRGIAVPPASLWAPGAIDRAHSSGTRAQHAKKHFLARNKTHWYAPRRPALLSAESHIGAHPTNTLPGACLAACIAKVVQRVACSARHRWSG